MIGNLETRDDPDAASVTAGGASAAQDSLDEAWYQFTMGNDGGSIPTVVDRLERAVSRAGLCGPEEGFRVAEALREALTNAIDHGNLELDSDLRQDDESAYARLGRERRGLSPFRERRVRVDAIVNRLEATIRVRDQGPGFDPSTLPDPCDPEQFERIGGRGLLLIRNFMDEVRHNDSGNEIILIKRPPRPRS